MINSSATRILRTLFPAITLVLASGIQADANNGIYYQENFRNYTEQMPLTVDTEGFSVGNDPIHAQTSELNVNRNKDGVIFKEYVAASTQGLEKADVLFDFFFRSQDVAARKFDLLLRGQSGDIKVTITTKEIQVFAPNGNLVTKAELPSDIQPHVMRTGAVKISKGKLDLYMDELRLIKQVATAKIPDSFRLTGVNISAYANAPFSISELTVRDPAPLPDRSLVNSIPLPRKVNVAAFKKGASVDIPANDLFGATVLTGLGDGIKVVFQKNDGTEESITLKVTPFNTGGDKWLMQRLGISDDPRPDSIIHVSRGRLDFHIRPLLQRYRTSYSYTNRYVDIVRDWDQLPKASEHPLKIELRRSAKGADLYLDGRFAGTIEGNLKGLRIEASPTAAVGPVFSQKSTFDSNKFLPLDLPALARARAFATATTSINPGWAQVQNIPMIVASGTESADVGLTRVGQGNWALEVDEYTARTPFNGFLHEIHFSVPDGIPYTKAWVLCTVDPDETKDPILTTRLAKYINNGAGGNWKVDTVLTLPRAGETPGEGIKVVGKVAHTDASGKKVELPLYLVEVPIRVGEIIDLALGSAPLSFEFFGKPWKNLQQIDKSTQPDENSTSAVQIFGVTLEKAHVGLEMVQSQPANVFHNDEVPETTAVLKAIQPAKGKLAWEIFGLDEKKVSGGTKDFDLRTVGAEQRIPISLKAPQLGWYRLLISVQDHTGNVLYTHPASFALLGKDQRKAKYESPFGTWWFDGAHITPSDVEFAGPVMFKAGMRKAGWTGQPESAMSKWFISSPQIATNNNPDLMRSNPDKYLANVEADVRAKMAKYPHVKELMIFHESGHNQMAPELFGGKVDISNATPYQKRYADLMNTLGKLFREKFPHMTIVVGNSNSSQGVIAEALRYGGDPKYIDYIGIETPSQVFIPEKLQENTIQGLHLARDTMKAFTGYSAPITGSYEFTYRTVRDLGPHRQAEWYVRDSLLSLANSFTNITPGILFDASTCYYNFYWGASGMLERGPWGYPKPSYVAFAVLTNVFDQTTFRRQVPTGSTTVYAIEFDRSDKKLVTALWAARGDAEFTIEYAGDSAVTIVDMYGPQRQEKTSGGKLTLKAGATPVYIVADKEIRSISHDKRSFPEDEMRNKHARVVAQLDNAILVKDDSLDTPRPYSGTFIPVRLAGKFEARKVSDSEQGSVLELELKKEGELNKYITEYAVLNLDTPAEVPGSPDALGVWVKGNSNWGRIMYEIEDAEGEVWRSIATGGWGCDVLDWPGDAAVNFDGWNFVSLPLRRSALFRTYSPGPVIDQWVSSGGNKKIDYPIKVRGLIVEMNRTPINLVDFVDDNTPVIRLKNISALYADQ